MAMNEFSWKMPEDAWLECSVAQLASPSICKLPMRVRCVFPDGSSRVVPIGAHPTAGTFQLIARNHVKDKCTHLRLRYGVLPSYTTLALDKEHAGQVLHGIKNNDAVWIEVCQQCRGQTQGVEVLANSEKTLQPAIHTLAELKPFSLPPFSEQTLCPNGYYYELAARTIGLENFKIYMFSCSPDQYFLYMSNVDRLNEVPPHLILLGSNDLVPEDFLIPGGILYQIIDSHTNLAHMSFYSFPMLPGRLFVYDGGLNRLTETRMSSRLAVSLLGEVESKPNIPSQATTEHTMPSKLSRKQDSIVSCSIAGTLNFKFENTVGLYSIPPPSDNHRQTSLSLSTVVCSGKKTSYDSLAATKGSTLSDQHFHSYCKSDIASCSQHTKFSVADITVYEPSSLTVPLPRPTSEPQCLTPPCVYSGRNDDPR